MGDIRVAIIGCGKIADQHAQQIRRVKGSRVVAVCDREKLMADQLAERFNIARSFDDIDELLEEMHPDVIHITTPPQSHFQLTRKCFEAGCHVYVEKPFSLDVREARAMLDLAKERNLQITAGHNLQFGPEMIRMRKLLDSGVLGDGPVHIESIYSYDLGDSTYVKALLGDQKHWVRTLPGKLLQNVISHGIAKIAEFLHGPEFSVWAQGFISPKLQGIGGNDIVDELRVAISDSQNLTAYFTFTTQIVPPVQELRVFGTNGSIVVDSLHRTLVHTKRSNSVFKSYLNFVVPPSHIARQYGRNAWSNVVSFLKADFHMDAGMKTLIEQFYRSISSGGPPPLPYREILVTATLMDAIFNQVHPTERAESSTADGRSVVVLSRDLV